MSGGLVPNFFYIVLEFRVSAKFWVFAVASELERVSVEEPLDFDAVSF